MQANDLISKLTTDQRAEFDRIKAVVMKLTPDAELTVSYGLLTFRYHSKGLLGWAAGKNFYSLYPFGKAVIEMLSDELTKYDGTPGSVHYSLDEPMPESLVEKIISEKLILLRSQED